MGYLTDKLNKPLGGIVVKNQKVIGYHVKDGYYIRAVQTHRIHSARKLTHRRWFVFRFSNYDDAQVAMEILKISGLRISSFGFTQNKGFEPIRSK